MEARDWAWVLIYLVVLGVAGLMGYAFWRGRNATVPGVDGDAYWQWMLRVQAIALSTTLAVIVMVLIAGLPYIAGAVAPTVGLAAGFAYLLMSPGPARSPARGPRRGSPPGSRDGR